MKAIQQEKKESKMFDYKTIGDRLRVVNWSNYSQPTGVITLSKDPTFRLPAPVVKSKGHTFKLL